MSYSPTIYYSTRTYRDSTVIVKEINFELTAEISVLGYPKRKIKSFLENVLRLYPHFGRKLSASFDFFYKNTGTNDFKRNCVGSRLYGPLGFGIQRILKKRVFYMFCLALVSKLLTVHSE